MRIASVVASMALAATLFASGNLQAHEGDSSVKVTTLMGQPLADYPGKEGVLAMVEFAPGQVDAAHRHPGHVFVYTFYENPKDTHPVGRNVSKIEPAKLLVFFVTDQNVPLVLPPQR